MGRTWQPPAPMSGKSSTVTPRDEATSVAWRLPLATAPVSTESLASSSEATEFALGGP